MSKKRQYNHYTKEFKEEAVALVREQGYSVVNNNRKVIHPHQLKSDPLFFRVFH